MLPEAASLDWCLALTTDKSPNDIPNWPQIRSFVSRLQVSWHKSNESETDGTCSMGFRGYQSHYKLAPDFGSYPACEGQYIAHRRALADRMMSSSNRYQTDPDDQRCPIKFLPLGLRIYQVCKIQSSNDWYTLDFHSETNLEYRNHTIEIKKWKGRRFFRPLIRTRLYDQQFFSDLLQIRSAYSDCEASNLLKIEMKNIVRHAISRFVSCC